MIFKKENIDTNKKKKLRYFTLNRDIKIYIELILNMFSTTEIESFLAKNTTLSSFWNTKLDLGIITFLSLKIAPILISSGKLEFFNSLLINSEVSIISASITSYSPLRIVYAVSIVPLWTCFKFQLYEQDYLI